MRRPFAVGDLVQFEFFGPRVGSVVGMRPAKAFSKIEWFVTVKLADGQRLDKRSGELKKLDPIQALGRLA